jgi:crotonobetainyl-CoA hydratase
MTDSVICERHGAVLLITLNRPKANAIDALTSHAMGEAFVNFANDPSLSVAVVTGSGERFFSAGWDLKAAAEGEAVDADFGRGGFAGLTELWDLDTPVLAAVNGYAAGGGFELALAADLIIAANHAQFFLPEATLGIIPDSGGVLRLPQRLPQAVAMDMLMSGRRMAVEEAMHFGLINRHCEGEQLLEQALAWAQEIALSAPLSLASIKTITRATHGMPLEQAYKHMREAVPVYQAMLHSEDASEGPQAFAEKRTPQWQGR